jgi:hypothetical protein
MSITKYFEAGWMIYRKTDSRDAAGGLVETYSTHAQVEGRMRPRDLAGIGLSVLAGKVTYIATHRFYCEPIDILEGDRLVKGSDTYDVKHVGNVMTFDRHYQVDCELIR